jgi:hypothetical protein
VQSVLPPRRSLRWADVGRSESSYHAGRGGKMCALVQPVLFLSERGVSLLV